MATATKQWIVGILSFALVLLGYSIVMEYHKQGSANFTTWFVTGAVVIALIVTAVKKE